MLPGLHITIRTPETSSVYGVCVCDSKVYGEFPECVSVHGLDDVWAEDYWQQVHDPQWSMILPSFCQACKNGAPRRAYV